MEEILSQSYKYQILPESQELQSLSLTISPVQLAPPLLGAGSEHSLRLSWTPGPPQVTLQAPQGLQSDQLPSTGPKHGSVLRLILTNNFCDLHGSLLQSWVSTFSPGHSLPPSYGEGLLQSLMRTLNPPPQVLLHGANGLHSLHPPSTGPILGLFKN